MIRRRSFKSRFRLWLSKRNTKNQLFTFFYTFLWLFVLFFVIRAFLFSPLFAIQSIKITNETIEKNKLSDELVQDISFNIEEILNEKKYYISGRERYRFNKTTLQNKVLEKHILFKDIDITETKLGHFSVSFEKRNVFGTYCEENICFFIDKSGFVFAKNPNSPNYILGERLKIIGHLSTGELVFNTDTNREESFEKISTIIEYLENNLTEEIDKQIQVKQTSITRDARDIRIELENDFIILVDTSESINKTTKALYLGFVELIPREKNVDILDIRDPDKIVIYERKKEE